MKERLQKPRQSSTARQIKALQMRVGFLEKALKPARKRSSTDELSRSREHAEEMARYKAMMEYYQQKKVEYYLRNPSDLAKDLAREREVADFLRARGIKPEPSRIPEQFHRGLKAYRPKAAKTTSD